jgi:hypothetical protein
MNADKDPAIARALDLLVPPVEGDAEGLLSSARVDSGRLRAARRRRRWVAGLALAAVVLPTGAAIAARELNLLPFLQTHDRNTARYSVDQSRVYGGGSPPALDCPAAGPGRFVCTPRGLAAGTRAYVLAARVIAQPELTRAGMMAQLATAEDNGVSKKEVDRVRGDLARVSDDFIRSLNLIVSIETIAGDQQVSGHPDLELVPPAGVPTWIVCQQESKRAFLCRTLAASANVPVNTPIYELRPSNDWHAIPKPKQQPLELRRLVAAILGRQPTQDEIHVLLDLVRVASVSGSSGPHNPTITREPADQRPPGN